MKYALSASSLQYRQALPLEVKVVMAKRRIADFIDEYGPDGVYVSFSGGKDSTVLMDIVRKYCPKVPGVFLDTWMEYPQIRAFVKSYDNVEIIKPMIPLKTIIHQYGWCFPSKDVAEAIWYARRGSQWAINKLHGLDKDGKVSEFRQQYKKWLPLYESDIAISQYCCIKQKEEPIAVYEEHTGRHPILALMAEESKRRKEAYLRTGCNSFSSSRPMCRPMGPWREQDVLRYITENSLTIASPYGQIVEVGQIEGQMRMFPCGKLRCTQEQRTGCMFCPIGCHLDGLGKFRRLKAYNPELYDYCMEELGEKKLLEWVIKNYLKGDCKL